jgi:hypothetical protein
MSTSGHLKFQGTNRATFVGTTSNIMFDTTSTSLGIGVTGTDHPSSNLYVTGNAYVSSNIAVGGVLTMGTVNVVARHDLEAVTATGNITPLTVEFTNPTTSLVASGNVEVGGELTVSGNVTATSNIEVTGFVGSSGTGAITVPSGTTAQQPSTGLVTGMVRFNETVGKMEFYNGTAWLSIGGISATGGTITNADGYKIHTFTSSGTFTMFTGSLVEYLIVAGGGGGGGVHAGGGGAGGVLSGTISKSPGSYTVTVGSGGVGHRGSPSANGTNGSPSEITNWLSGATTSAIGGGGGGSGYHVADTSVLSRVGSAGGSGGGGGPYHGGGSGTSGQGFNGGSGGNQNGAGHGGGGGGAGGVGGNSVSPHTSNGGISGAGGIGYTSSITGRPVIYAGGGSGGRWTGNNTNPGRAISVGTVEGGGGLGGAETLNQYNNYDGQNAEANTGGGGGGGGDSAGPGGNGGSGIVILRYLL